MDNKQVNTEGRKWVNIVLIAVAISFMLIGLSQIVFGLATDITGISTNDLTNHYRAENNLNDSGSFNISLRTITPVPQYSTNRVEGVYSFKSPDPPSAIAYVQYDANKYGYFLGKSTVSLGGWMNVTDVKALGLGFLDVGCSGVHGMQIQYNSFQFRVVSRTSGGYIESAYYPHNPGWQHYAVTNNGTTIKAYLNGTNIFNQTGGSFTPDCPSWDFVINSDVSLDANIGLYDDIAIFNVTLTPAQVREWANQVLTPDAPIFSVPTPSNNSITNTQISINASCVASNLKLYFDNVSSPTTVVSSISPTILYNTTVTVDGRYYYMADCVNTTNNRSSGNSTVRTWTYDTTTPTFTFNNGNSFRTDNRSNTNQYTSNDLVFNLTFADNNLLYAYEINITSNQNNSMVYYELNETINKTSINYSKIVSTANWNDGLYTIRMYLADAHTSKSIPDYILDNKKSKLQFKTPTGNNIKIETDDSSNVGTLKIVDRYMFNFTFDDGLVKNRTFNVKSDLCPLKYMGSVYPGHFVSYCPSLHDGNWIDFDGVGQYPIVTKVDDYHFTVKFINLPPTITFNSIGGLNVKSANFTWYKGEYTFNNVDSIVNQSITLFLNTSRGVSISNLTALLYYFNISRAITTTISGDSTYFSSTFNTPLTAGVYNFTWNITVTQANVSIPKYTFNVSSSNNVFPGVTANVTIRDEITGIIINSTGLGTNTFNILFTRPGIQYTYTTTKGTLLTDYIAIGDYVMTVINTEGNYSTRYYTITLNTSSVQHFTAYMTLDTQAVTFTVFETVDNKNVVLDGARIDLFGFVNTSYLLVESRTTDVSGRAVFSVRQNIPYSILVSKSGYNSATYNFNPIQFTAYNVPLNKSNIFVPDNDTTIYLNPRSIYINKANTVTFAIASPNNLLTAYNYVVAGNCFVTQNASGSISGGQLYTLSINPNTSCAVSDNIYFNYTYTLVSGTYRTYSQPITIIRIVGNNTIAQNLDNTFGMSLLERTMLVTIIVLVFAGLGAYFGGDIVGLTLGLFILGYFNFFTSFGTLWANIITIVIGVILLITRSVNR